MIWGMMLGMIWECLDFGDDLGVIFYDFWHDFGMLLKMTFGDDLGMILGLLLRISDFGMILE